MSQPPAEQAALEADATAVVRALLAADPDATFDRVVASLSGLVDPVSTDFVAARLEACGYELLYDSEGAPLVRPRPRPRSRVRASSVKSRAASSTDPAVTPPAAAPPEASPPAPSRPPGPWVSVSAVSFVIIAALVLVMFVVSIVRLAT